MPIRLTICLLSALFLLQAGAVERRKLNAPAEFQGYPCAAGYAWFFPDGRLSDCHVSREIRFGELTVPALSEISLTESGEPRFVFLAKDTREGSVTCRGGQRAWSTAVYPDGKLKTCWLASDTLIGGAPCMRASFAADVFGGGAETEFFEDGHLKACKLARDSTVDGHPMRRGEHVRR